MNYKPGWDTEWDAAVPDFDSDLRFGMRGEEAQSEVWRIIREQPHCVEVKSERNVNGRHFIETHQLRRGCTEYEPSGLLTTTSTIWVVLTGSPPSSLKVYAVRDLRAMWERGQMGDPRDGGLSGDNPTKGHVVSFLALDQVIHNNKQRGQE